jgi:glutamine synthetase
MQALVQVIGGDRAVLDPDIIAAGAAGSILELIRRGSYQYTEFWFTDLSGHPWRIGMRAKDLNAGILRTGLPLDGQPVGGAWDGVMNLLPRPDAVYPDGGTSVPTLAMICDVLDPLTNLPLPLEPRHVLRRAEQQVRASLGAGVRVGVEPEFLLFENGGRLAGEDTVWEFLRGLAVLLEGAGIPVDWFRYGPAVGQGRVQMQPNSALLLADRVMVYRHLAAGLARRRGLAVSFLPRPLADGGTPGMPIHQTLWRDGKNLFHDASGWSLTSQLCRWYAGGLLAHLPALMAFCGPTTNSYRRLIPGVCGPTEARLSTVARAAACRIPVRNAAPGARRVKFCCADSTANPYLALSAVIMAGLDGILRRAEPPVDGSPAMALRFPGSLGEALDALAADRSFLTGVGVFSNELIDAWIKDRWERHVLPVRSRPHPWELAHADVFGCVDDGGRVQNKEALDAIAPHQK